MHLRTSNRLSHLSWLGVLLDQYQSVVHWVASYLIQFPSNFLHLVSAIRADAQGESNAEVAHPPGWWWIAGWVFED